MVFWKKILYLATAFWKNILIIGLVLLKHIDSGTKTLTTGADYWGTSGWDLGHGILKSIVTKFSVVSLDIWTSQLAEFLPNFGRQRNRCLQNVPNFGGSDIWGRLHQAASGFEVFRCWSSNSSYFRAVFGGTKKCLQCFGVSFVPSQAGPKNEFQEGLRAVSLGDTSETSVSRAPGLVEEMKAGIFSLVENAGSEHHVFLKQLGIASDKVGLFVTATLSELLLWTTLKCI